MPALTVDNSATATQMASEILGLGFSIDSAFFFGDANSSGTYSGGDTSNPGVLPSDTGVILSTGNTSDFANATGANNQSGSTSTNTGGVNGNAAFDAAAGSSTFDASYLVITFTPEPGQTSLNIEFRFYSEEYNEYVYSNFNDIALVQLDGVTQPISVGTGEISVNSINDAATFNPANGSEANDPNPGNGQFDSSNPNLYIDNSTGTHATEMDGFTVTLSLDIPVTPGLQQTLMIGIADVGDSSWDSSLVIASNQQTGTEDNDPIATDDTGIQTFGANPRTVDILANDSDPNGQPLTITQINGVNVVAGQTVTLNTGETVTLNADGTITLINVPENVGLTSFSYTVSDTDGNTDSAFVTFDAQPICFTPGVLIDTPFGPRPVEHLRAGDQVITRDNGVQVVRWVGRRDVDLASQTQSEKFTPIRIRKGALGPNLPAADMWVSPRHQILIKSPEASLLFGDSEVFCAADHLVNRPGISRDETREDVAYIHLLFDRHEVIRANGLCSESLYPGQIALDGLDDTGRAEVFDLFPELRSQAGFGPAARYVARRREAALLVA